MLEQWKDLDFEISKKYQVSNFGNVRVDRKGEWIEVKKSLQSAGYYKVNINIGKYKNKTLLVHRLVATSFIENKNDYQQVNHIDGNKQNNIVNNLEWCSPVMNVRHSHTIHPNGNFHKGVIQYKDGIEIARFKSITEIEKVLGFHRQNVSACCLGKNKTYKGFEWKYATDTE